MITQQMRKEYPEFNCGIIMVCQVIIIVNY